MEIWIQADFLDDRAFYSSAPYSTTESPVEGIDFFALDPSVPSHYDTFGHQVLGIYLGPTPSGFQFSLAVHTGTTPTDEAASVYTQIPLPFTGTATSPQVVDITYTQLAQVNWIIKMISGHNVVPAKNTAQPGTLARVWTRYATSLAREVLRLAAH